jgi:hypothetical protein
MVPNMNEGRAYETARAQLTYLMDTAQQLYWSNYSWYSSRHMRATCAERDIPRLKNSMMVNWQDEPNFEVRAAGLYGQERMSRLL